MNSFTRTFTFFVYFEWLLETHLRVYLKHIYLNTHLLETHLRVFFPSHPDVPISLAKLLFRNPCGERHSSRCGLFLETLKAKGFQDEQESFRRALAFHNGTGRLVLCLFILI